MTDLISRQAAIEALDALCDRECEYSKKQRSVMCGACHLGSAFDVIEQLPSAQPTQSNAVQHVESVGDCISRQAAIDVFKRELTTGESKREYVTTCCAIGYEGIKRILESIPSALPEIIRCKDCRHRDVENGFCEGRGWPMQLVPDDGFCDKGERSEE